MSNFTYESEEILAQYLLFHYGTPEQQMPWDFGPTDGLNFPARCAETLDTGSIPADARALDLGCAVGRSTFELARYCHEVIGIDYSHSFIKAAEEISKGPLPYTIKESGAIVTPAIANVPDNVDVSRVRFRQGDAQHLPEDLGSFEVVIACNLLCRLPDPQCFLERLPNLVKKGGQLLFTTPCTWLEEYTPRANWIGATPEKGETFIELQKRLQDHFDLRKTLEIPFLIREHARKYQWSVAQGSLWIRR